MIELEDKELMLVRGQYATINGEYKDGLKELQMLTGALSSVAAQVLHGVQPKDESEPINVTVQLESGRLALEKIERCVARLGDLQKQRLELRPLAWPR
jgi:hypothetical protein